MISDVFEVIHNDIYETYKHIEVNFPSDVLEFSMSDEQLAKPTCIAQCLFNNQAYLVRRSTNTDSNNSKLCKEIKLLKRRIHNVIEFHCHLESDKYSYLVMLDPGMKLIDFLYSCNWDTDICKLILDKVGNVVNDLHKIEMYYGNQNLIDDIYVKQGSTANDLTVRVVNFWWIDFFEIKEPETDTPTFNLKHREQRVSCDAKSFKDLIWFLLTKGSTLKINSWNLMLMTKSLYYDFFTLRDLFSKIVCGFPTMSDILKHPALWTNQKTLDFFEHIYVLTTFWFNNITLKNEKIFREDEGWDLELEEIVLQDAAFRLHRKNEEKREKKKRQQEILRKKAHEANEEFIEEEVEVRKQDVNVYTMEGLIAFIRHACKSHYFNQNDNVRIFLGYPPKGIAQFIKSFPNLLIYLYRVAEPVVEIQSEILQHHYTCLPNPPKKG